jgi:selenocysteine lyase/cysteine desulfurase
MLGPEGCGILYIRRDIQDRIEPVEFGWTNVAGYADYASRDMTLWNDARRYECGTLNTIGCFGLKASIEFLLEVDPGQIGPVVQHLGDRIAAGVERKGYQLLATRTPESGAGIVSFRKPGQNPAEVVAHLRTQNIVAAPRAGWIRTAPHFYIAPEEIDRLIDALP